MSEEGKLTFDGFSRANAERSAVSFDEDVFSAAERRGDAWAPADWMVAAMGELGEAANVMKKIRRGDPGFDYDQVLDELADTVTYIDLLCSALGYNLGDAVVRKFNRVSLRMGSDRFISNGSEDG